MGAVSSFKRRLLAKAYTEALKIENGKIGDFLYAYSDKLLEEVEGGKTLASFASNGTSSTFALTEKSTIPLRSQLEVIDSLIRLYENALAVLADPSNQNVYVWMLAHLGDRRCIQFEEVFHPRFEILTPQAKQ